MPRTCAIAAELLEECAAADVILEIEVGVVGGEEDGVSGEDAAEEQLYSTPEDALAVAEALGLGERGRYLVAATFGNVHGVYAPVNTRLRPEILGELRDAIAERYGPNAPFDFVFHGGSGSTDAQIAEAVGYGVVKMNVDTDMQYAYTRAVADHVFRRYDGVLKVDGEMGDKKAYDPRAWGREAEASMAARVVEACRQLGSAGRAHHRAAVGRCTVSQPDDGLVAAAGRGDLDEVRALLAGGADVDSHDGAGRSAVAAAVYGGHAAVVRTLVGAGADVDLQDDNRANALLATGEMGDVEVLREVLRAGPDLSRTNRFGGIVLIPASERGHVDVVRELLETDIDVDHVNDLGWTALLEAVMLGDGGPVQQEIVGLLVDAGADRELADRDGITPLDHARRLGYVEIERMLEGGS